MSETNHSRAAEESSPVDDIEVVPVPPDSHGPTQSPPSAHDVLAINALDDGSPDRLSASSEVAVRVALGASSVSAAHRSNSIDHKNERAAGPRYKFVFWAHVAENSKAAAEQMVDCDIIALELYGMSARVRRRLETNLSTVLSSQATPKEKKQANGRLHQVPIYRELLNELPVRDQEVFLIDVDDDSTSNATDKLNVLPQLKRHASNEVLKARLLRGFQRTAAENTTRESHVVEQLEAIGARSGNEHKLIGVLPGALHTPEEHMLSRTAKTERVFVDTRAGFEISRPLSFKYNYEDQVLRQLRLRPNDQISDALLNRVLLAKTFDVYGNYRHSMGLPELKDQKSLPTLNAIQASIVDKMSDQEVAGLLLTLDATRKGRGRRFRGGQISREESDLLEDTRIQMEQRH